MALQSSGAISISDIKTELGSSSNSLATLSVAAGKTQPHSMSEFYGYSAYSNVKYYRNDGTGDYVSGYSASAPFNINTTQDLTISMWVRPQNVADQNHMMINFGNTDSNGNNRLFISYTANVNRIIARVRTNSVNFDRQWALHDNTPQTGLSSTNAWSANNRGNTNAAGWTNLTITYDASAPEAEAAFKLYWNGSECQTTASAANGTRTGIGANYFKIGENLGGTNSGGNAYMDFDEIKVFSSVLSSATISDIYNSGTIADSTQTTNKNLITEWTFEGSNGADSNSRYSGSITNGIIVNH